MKRFLLPLLLLSLLGFALSPSSVFADSGHARIVRLSLVQGTVSYTRAFHKDSLDDSRAVWEPAPLNLPIREGFALSTDSGARAEVEFENGAMAFLSGNTVLEFYDLSLDDGALITRLVLRQGSAIFYVHPAKVDFFSVTGGDFSVEADGRARFRLDNYDDGSTVNVEQGQVSVLRNDETKPLEKGQSYSININDAQKPIIARNADSDDFDKWVSGRVDSVVTATTYSQQYVRSPDYSSGLSDLYNYGGWYSVPGYGYGWQPYGVGLGWNPFTYGSWGYDSFFGWNFIGSAPWGWLPYHYGGWIFNPVLGWMWVPSGLGYNGPVAYRPVTAVWVHSPGVTGIVPLHPADTHGKAPMNLAQGVYGFQRNTVEATPLANSGQRWSVESHPPRDVLTAGAAAPVPAPTRVSRTILSGASGSRAVTLSRDSSIVYDPAAHTFVNNGSQPSKTETAKTEEPAKAEVPATEAEKSEKAPAGENESAKPATARASRTAAPRPTVAPPPPTSTHGTAHSSGTSASESDSAGSTSSRSSTSSTTTASPRPRHP